jgi:ABC-type branched-subunit amino acid transport system permease subunit
VAHRSNFTSIISIGVGYILLRIKGVYFILVTFGLIEIFRIVFTNFWKPLFGGAMGIVGIPAPMIRLPFLGPIVFSSKVPYYYLALCLSIFSLWIMYRIEKSAIGKIFFSIIAVETVEKVEGCKRKGNGFENDLVGCPTSPLMTQDDI